jgi:hypothetical protein
MGVAMNRTGMLPAAMTALEVLSERLTQLSGGLVSAEAPIEGPAGSSPAPRERSAT